MTIAATRSVRNVTATSPRSRVAACERSSGRLPRYVYGLVLRMIEKYPSSRRCSVPAAEREVRMVPVVAARPGRECCRDEQGVTEPALHRGVPLDPADDGGVEPDPGVEAEEPAVDASEPDRADVVGPDPVRQQVDGGDRIVRQPERAGEHVRRSAREHAERGVGPGDPGRDLVERAVAAEADDDVEPAPCRVGRVPRRVPAPVGLDDLDVVVACEPSVDHDRVASRDRRRKRVDHEQDPHAVKDKGRLGGKLTDR